LEEALKQSCENEDPHMTGKSKAAYLPAKLAGSPIGFQSECC
jgi:hypothetical protein